MRPRTLAVALMAVFALVAARPAAACRCLTPSLPRVLAAADVVLVGTVRRVDVGDHAIATVVVEGVWKGAVGATVELHDSPTSCRRGFTAGQRLIVMARRDGDRLTVRQCDGTQRATATVERRITRRLGAPRAPTP